jgi:broad specificity phosphatase PhoE
MADPLSADYPVESRGDLMNVLNSLAVLHETSPGQWENPTIAAYLDAIVRWIEDSDGYYRNRGEEPPGESWRFMADALRAGRFYE